MPSRKARIQSGTKRSGRVQPCLGEYILPIGVPDDATREAVDAPVLGARRTPTAPNEAPNAATDQFGTDGPDINEVARRSVRDGV